MRVVFMGTPGFSVHALDALVRAGHEIACVYTQPPRPAGRGKKPRPSAVQARAEELGLMVRHPISLKGAEAQADFAALEADVAVVVAYGLILPQPILDAPPGFGERIGDAFASFGHAFERLLYYPGPRVPTPRLRTLPATRHHLELVFDEQDLLTRYLYAPRPDLVRVPVDG